MKKFLTLALLALFCVSSYAQDKRIMYAKTYIENERRRDYHMADSLLQSAMNDPKVMQKQHDHAMLYFYAGSARYGMLSEELNKAARNIPFDTLTFTEYLETAIEYFGRSWEADHQPNYKGDTVPSYEGQVTTAMERMLPYYNYLAMWSYQGGHMDKAATYFEKYLTMPYETIFSKGRADQIVQENAQAYMQAKISLAQLNYRMEHWPNVEKYTKQILTDDPDNENKHDLYQMLMASYLQRGDSTQWLATLKDAVANVPESNTFPQNLLNYYVVKGDTVAAEEMANEFITNHPDNKNAWYIKGCVDLNMTKQFDAARESFEKAVAIDPDFANAHFNLGVSYINEVIARRNNGEFETDRYKVEAYKAGEEKIREYYRKALPHFERVRELLPDRPNVWAMYLENVYSNLQMEDKAEEMKQYLNN